MSVAVGHPFRSVIPKGRVDPIELSITDVITELNSANTLSLPWMTMDLYNDGPDPVYVAFNGALMEMQAPLKEGEDLKVDMKRRQISSLRLICDAGETAGIRIFTKS